MNNSGLRLASVLILFSAVMVFGEELPKACFGRYGGEMPGYSVEMNGNAIEIEKHDVFITIDEESIIYQGGNLELSGKYKVFRQSKNEFAIKTELTNGKSLSYEMNLVWNKKEHKMYITPKNGQSEAVLEYLGD